MNPRLYEGECHCGLTGFSYLTSRAPENWSVRACDCRFCRAHGALSTSDPEGQLHFFSRAAGQLRQYRFAMRTADFLLCVSCGIYLGAVIETPAGRFGIINTRALSPQPADLAAPARANYDAEDLAGRVARRQSNWTPVTSIVD